MNFLLKLSFRRPSDKITIGTKFAIVPIKTTQSSRNHNFRFRYQSRIANLTTPEIGRDFTKGFILLDYGYFTVRN